MSIIGIVIGLTAIGLFIWFKNDQQMNNALYEGELEAAEHGFKALMDDLNHYQARTDREIAELKKQLEIKINNIERRMDKNEKELPSVIGKVVGQIELAQDRIKRQM